MPTFGDDIKVKDYNNIKRTVIDKYGRFYLNFAPGNQWYVNSNGGDSSYDGKTWGRPLDTINNAKNKCAAGDVIWVAPGHTETYTTTGSKLVVDIDGISIIGLGAGSNRPTISFGHTGTTMTISANNVILNNLLFVTAVDSVVTLATISGDDCALVDCESRDTTDIEVITDFTITGDRFQAIRHFKNGYVSGNANDCVFSLNGVDNALIKDCIFITKVLTAVIEYVTASCKEVIIDNCVFSVDSTTDLSKNVVDTIGSSTYLVTKSFDMGSGGKFSGGSGDTIAGDDISSVANALYGANGITTFPASAAPANGVSMAEVLRDIWDVLRNGTGGSEPSTNLSILDVIKQNDMRYSNPKYLTVIADLTSATWNTVATHKLFTVTGLVRMKVIAQVVGNVSSGAGGSIELGNEEDTDSWIATTTMADLADGEVWKDATPTEKEGDYSSLVFDKVINGLDIGYEIKSNPGTGGTIVFHCTWEALNSTGNVVVGDGSALV